MMAPLEAISAASIFEAALKKVATSVIVGAGKSIVSALSTFSVDFGDHLRQSFERCTKIRTILNRDESIELLSLYVHLNFVSGRKQKIDDYSLIEHIRTGKRIVISGSGGGGKSMFMRYLWISLFENPDARVPVFIELRRFNDVTSKIS